MLVKNVGVELKRGRLDSMTSTDGIKIVLCDGVKKDGCSRTQQRGREEKGVPAVRRLGSYVLIRKVELRLMF
jgi:hypothetical protein